MGSVSTAIDTAGSTKLDQIGSNYYLDSGNAGSGPELTYSGGVVVVGQFGAWTPIGAEATSGGYEVAWKIPGTDQYTVWKTDSSGNFVSNVTGVVSGTSSALKSLESIFQQDLNGDGVIATPTAQIVKPNGSYSGSITFADA